MLALAWDKEWIVGLVVRGNRDGSPTICPPKDMRALLPREEISPQRLNLPTKFRNQTGDEATQQTRWCDSHCTIGKPLKVSEVHTHSTSLLQLE